MKRIYLLPLFLLLALPLRAQDIPPVTGVKIVATYCRHCGLIEFEKGETHRSDCPYVNGSSSADERSYGSGRDSYEDRHESAWEARQAAKEAKKAERDAKKTAKAVEKYTRTSNHKLKDYVPNAGKTVVALKGATASASVYAKYDKKGVPTYGLKNNSGKWIRKPQYQAITIVGPAVAAYKKKGNVGLLNPNTGEPLLEGDYDHYKAFYYPDNARNTVVALGRTGSDGKDEWHLMRADENGNYVEGMVCTAAEFYEDGTGRKIAYRRADTKKVGMADEFGKEILPPIFDGLKYLEYSVDGASYYQASMLQADGNTSLVGVIDDKGRVVVPCTYDKVDAKSWGKYGIQVEKEGKVGVFDMTGQQVLPDSFDSLDLDHFWKDGRHWAFFRGWTTDSNGKRYCALFSTTGEQLTDFKDENWYSFEIEDQTNRLEEYRIY